MDAVVVAAAMAAVVDLPVCSSSIFKSRLLHKGTAFEADEAQEDLLARLNKILDNQYNSGYL